MLDQDNCKAWFPYEKNDPRLVADLSQTKILKRSLTGRRPIAGIWDTIPRHRWLKKTIGLSCIFTNLHQNQFHLKGNMAAVNRSLLQSRLLFLVILLWHGQRKNGIKRKLFFTSIFGSQQETVLPSAFCNILYYFHPCLHFHLPFLNKNKVKLSQLCVVCDVNTTCAGHQEPVCW